MSALSITASQVIPSSQASLRVVKLGAACTAGQPLYKNSDVYNLAGAENTASAVVAGIACTSGSTGQSIVMCVSDPEFTLGSSALAANKVGQHYLLHTTEGLIVPISDLFSGVSSYYHCSIGTCVAVGKIAFDFSTPNVPFFGYSVA